MTIAQPYQAILEQICSETIAPAGPLDLGPRVFTRCRNMPETSYSLVAELAGRNAKRRDSLRFHPYGFTVGWHPRQLLCFNMGPWAHEKFRGSVTYASGPYPPMPEGRESSQWR